MIYCLRYYVVLILHVFVLSRSDLRIALDTIGFMVAAFSLGLLGHLLDEKPFNNQQRVRVVLVFVLDHYYQYQCADSADVTIAPSKKTVKTVLVIVVILFHLSKL